MLNNPNNSKLDQTVKQTLSNYEAPYNAADWSKMENLLDTAPKSSNFHWPNSLTIFIGLVVLSSAYFIFHSPKTPEKTTNSAPVETIENTVVKKTAPAIRVTPPIVSPTTKNMQPSENKSNTLPVNNQSVLESAKTPEAAETQKNKINKEENTTVKKDEKIDPTKHQRIFKMGNEPIFGDMLDSSKGIVGKTQEKEETKKAAKTQPNAIGWSSFILQNNLDSLKKFHLKQQKDSLKK